MTDKQLELIGITPVKTNLHPNRYWCSATEKHINITKDMSGEDILSIIVTRAYVLGIETGKAQRSQEFKNLCNNI